MFTFTWNDAYENAPTENLSRSSIDDEIRRIKIGVRERMEKEHEWGPYSEKNDGSHKQGKVKICNRGTVLQRDALVNVRTGAIYIVDDSGNYKTSYYDGTSWIPNLTSNDHEDLNGLSEGNPHPQYASPVMSNNYKLNANSNKVLITDVNNSNVLTWSHYNEVHAHSPIDSPLSLGDRSIGTDFMKATIVESNFTKEYTNYHPSTKYYNEAFNVNLSDAPHFLVYMRAYILSRYEDESDIEYCNLYACTNNSWGFRLNIRTKCFASGAIFVADAGLQQIKIRIDWKFLRLDV